MAMDLATYESLLRDITAETADLVSVLDGLNAAEWNARTPSEGWNVHDQVVHLAYFDDIATLGFEDPDAFEARAAELLATDDDWVDQISSSRSSMPPDQVLTWLAASRQRLLHLFESINPTARSAWFGPSMSAASSATARLMETWAHGQDVYDTVGVEHPATDRVRHVAHLGVITRGFSYHVRGLTPPSADVRVELSSPSGQLWEWGNRTAVDRVSGPAVDFALVVTQRRHHLDTRLHATPGSATEWLEIAQAFAGAPTIGRAAGMFPERKEATEQREARA